MAEINLGPSRVAIMAVAVAPPADRNNNKNQKQGTRSTTGTI
jgi:hypothetical protein